MQSIKQVQRLNDTELEKVVPSNASWHTDYRDTAYIYIGGLPFELSEGDILTIFSQYGNPVHINLVRDKETGKSRGYCFLKYEDQRSCDLAVDNLSGAGVMGRLLSVDHTRYKKKDGEVEGVGDVEEVADETDEEGQSRSKRRRTDSLSEGEQERPMIQEESELAKLRREMDDEDPMKAYMVKEKQVEVEEALKALAMSKHKSKDSGRDREHKHRHRHHRSERELADEEQAVKRDGHKSRRDRALDEKATTRPSHIGDGDGA
ncbi:RNA-binding protein Cwf29 [Friedmanniomyces endolithicus]|nr:RNA-binding protein Cwf29 [Friedmanniomyces endolithicus]KAK0778881.1 RNA-binding protein Cwf29 [Friedmanniomyces endolithicus]